MQSGDPSGTGEGGLSSLNNGGGFAEKNRLKHTGAGVLSYVQHPDGLYRSQFYLTLKVRRVLGFAGRYIYLNANIASMTRVWSQY